MEWSELLVVTHKQVIRAGHLSADNFVLWQMWVVAAHMMAVIEEACEWRKVGSELWRCCSFVVMVVEVFISYIVAAVGTSKLDIIVPLYTLRDKSRVLGM